jgi:hypothetical protein
LLSLGIKVVRLLATGQGGRLQREPPRATTATAAGAPNAGMPRPVGLECTSFMKSAPTSTNMSGFPLDADFGKSTTTGVVCVAHREASRFLS